MLKSHFFLGPLLLTAALMLGSNGLLGAYIPLLAAEAGFSSLSIGLLGSAYYLGFVLGSLYGLRLTSRVGHIRAISAMSAVGGSCVILYLLTGSPFSWTVLRLFSGFSFAVIFVVLESWINEMTDNRHRGTITGIYRIVDMASVMIGQYMLIFSGHGPVVLLGVIAIFHMMSAVPVSAFLQPAPASIVYAKTTLREAFSVSPLAFGGVLMAGASSGAFRSLAPTFALESGFSPAGIATFMNSLLIGGVLLLLPFGWLSDRHDRRVILVITAAGAAIVAGLALLIPRGSVELASLAVLLYGALAMPAYSISAAHGNDFARPDQFVSLSASLLFVYGIGATVGPFIASGVMEIAQASGLFIYLAGVHLLFVIFGIQRLVINRQKPSGNIVHFLYLPRTSPVFFAMIDRIARRKTRRDEKDAPPENGQD